MACSSCGSTNHSSSSHSGDNEMPSGNFFTGYNAYSKKFPIFTPQQQAFLSQILGQSGQALKGLNALQQPLGLRRDFPNVPEIPQLPGAKPLLNLQQSDKYGFEPIAQQARGRFYGQTLPGLAERFTAMGGTGRSAGFGNLMNQQSGQFEQGLAALQSQYGQQERGQTFQERSQQNSQQLALDSLLNQLGLQRSNQQLQRAEMLGNRRLSQNQQRLQQRSLQQSGLQGLLQMGLTPQFNTASYPAQPGFLQNLFSGFAQAAPFLMFG